MSNLKGIVVGVVLALLVAGFMTPHISTTNGQDNGGDVTTPTPDPTPDPPPGDNTNGLIQNILDTLVDLRKGMNENRAHTDVQLTALQAEDGKIDKRIEDMSALLTTMQTDIDTIKAHHPDGGGDNKYSVQQYRNLCVEIASLKHNVAQIDNTMCMLRTDVNKLTRNQAHLTNCVSNLDRQGKDMKESMRTLINSFNCHVSKCSGCAHCK